MMQFLILCWNSKIPDTFNYNVWNNILKKSLKNLLEIISVIQSFKMLSKDQDNLMMDFVTLTYSKKEEKKAYMVSNWCISDVIIRSQVTSQVEQSLVCYW